MLITNGLRFGVFLSKYRFKTQVKSHANSQLISQGKTSKFTK